MKIHRLLAVFCILILIFGFAAQRRLGTRPPDLPIESADALKTLFPEANSFTLKNTVVPHYIAMDQTHQALGFLLFTSHSAPDVYGYGGPIELALATDTRGTIQNVRLLKSNETTGYAQTLPDFLKTFAGKSLADPLELGNDVDGISGATVTSSAVTRSIRASLTKAQPLFQQKPSSFSASSSQKMSDVLIITVPILILFFLAVASAQRKRGFLTWTTLFLSFLYLGIFRRSMLATLQTVQIGLGILPGFKDDPAWYALIAGFVLTSLLWGRIYCAGVCPFAFVEEALYALRRKVWKHNFLLPIKAVRFSRWIKYAVFLSLLMCAFWLQSASPLAIEVYLTFFTGHANIFCWALLGCVVLASLFYYRFWCRYLCPFGACAGLIASFRIRRQTIKHAAHTEASSERACLTDIQKNKTAHLIIDAAECLHCGHCIRAGAAIATKHQTPKLFLIFLTSSLALLLFSTAWNIKEFKKTAPSQLLTKAGEPVQRPAPNLEQIRQQLEDSGIKPYPAQFWKTHDETNH